MKDLRVTLLQTTLHWEDISANLEMFSEKISGITETDLIVLPETFTTGFSMNPALAEPTNGSGVEWMKKMAAEKNCVITGSLMISEEGRFYNRLYWVRPDGIISTYDKRHLFSLSDEPKFFTPGENRLIVELNGWKICPFVCYDLRFPVWARNLNAEYEVLIYVANWPERRAQAWKSLLVARAIENQCYAIGVNRIGTDGNGLRHSGDSMALDSLGNVLYRQEHKEGICTVSLSYNDLKNLRELLPFLADADDFEWNPKRKIKGH